MSTQLFLTNTVADTHLGTDTLRGGGTGFGTASSWTSRALSTSRGSGVVASFATPTLTQATDGYQPIMASSGVYLEWISPPVAADVTISGTMIANVWAAESNMSANIFAKLWVDVIRANATATRNSNTLAAVGNVNTGTEVAVTTRAVRNATDTPASVTVNRGDRLRVWVGGAADPSVAATYTWNVGYNGTTEGADGDSWVQFSETFAFETTPGVWEAAPILASDLVFGGVAGQAALASRFVPSAADLTEVRVWLDKNGSPTDNVVLEIQSDSSGFPSNTVIGTIATVSGASLTTTPTQYTYSCSITLTPGTTYWIVVRRDGAVDAANNYSPGRTVPFPSVIRQLNAGTWVATLSDNSITARLTFTTTTLYLTDTASAVATASVDREAWTSRGAGVQTDVRNTAAGWTAPLQLTDTAGGTVVDWFTKQLTAFTLTGMAVANIRALESNASANSSVRCEIARVDSDGTNATVWASWCIAPTSTDNGELTTSEVARTANVSGDDLAFTDGQRIRVRLYVDDISSAAMGASQTVTVYYAGTSAAASGDSYITLAQSVTEYVSGTPHTATPADTLSLSDSISPVHTPGAAPGPPMQRQRRAHRHLTTRRVPIHR